MRPFRKTLLSVWLMCSFALVLAGQEAEQTRQTVVYSVTVNNDIMRPIWRYVQECSGLKPTKGGDLKDIKWFLVSPRGMRTPGGEIVLGQWRAPDSIFIDSAMAFSSWAIAHEMLHHLIHQSEPGQDHPHRPWAMPCMLMSGQNIPKYLIPRPEHDG